jgi:hypothetical protein
MHTVHTDLYTLEYIIIPWHVYYGLGVNSRVISLDVSFRAERSLLSCGTGFIQRASSGNNDRCFNAEFEIFFSFS